MAHSRHGMRSYCVSGSTSNPRDSGRLQRSRALDLHRRAAFFKEFVLADDAKFCPVSRTATGVRTLPRPKPMAARSMTKSVA